MHYKYLLHYINTEMYIRKKPIYLYVVFILLELISNCILYTAVIRPVENIKNTKFEKKMIHKCVKQILINGNIIQNIIIRTRKHLKKLKIKQSTDNSLVPTLLEHCIKKLN